VVTGACVATGLGEGLVVVDPLLVLKGATVGLRPEGASCDAQLIRRRATASRSAEVTQSWYFALTATWRPTSAHR
jgi:hypothetical protein